MDLIEQLIRRFLSKSLESGGHGRKRPETECPGHEILAAFYDGKLEQGAEEEVRKHLMTCDSCLELASALAPQLEEAEIEEKVRIPLKSLHRAMRLDPAREGAWDIVVDFARGVARSIKSAGEMAITAPVPAEAFRGGQQVISESLVAFKKDIPPFLAEIEVEKIVENRGEITVSVSEKETGKPAKGMRVSLFDPERELESYMLDQGRAIFENVKMGKYMLDLTQKGKKIGKISLNMKT